MINQKDLIQPSTKQSDGLPAHTAGQGHREKQPMNANLIYIGMNPSSADSRPTPPRQQLHYDNSNTSTNAFGRAT